MRKYLISLAFVVFGANAALADRPFNWTGFYVGAHGGFASGLIDVAGPNPPAGAPSQSIDGGFVGMQIGAQYQFTGGVVLGVEADASLANFSDTVRDGNYLTQWGTITSFGTVRARLGYAMGNFLPFITGGFAWDRLEEGQQCPDPGAVAQVGSHCGSNQGNAPYKLSKTQTNTGYVWGGGVDYRINNTWSVRLEGMRLEFDEEAYNLGAMANGNQNPTKKFEHSFDVFRFATNVRF